MSVAFRNVIARLRASSSLLRSAGWSVREGAVHSRGSVDLAAQRTWHRGTIEAVLHLLVVIDEAEGELAVSASKSKAHHAPLAFSLGDDDPELQLDKELAARLQRIAYKNGASITAPARVEALPARAHASFVRATSLQALDRTFAAIDGVREDLRRIAIETLTDDLELLSAEEASAAVAPFARRCDLLHGIVITDQTMRDEDIRLERVPVIGSGHRWIDVVQSNRFEDFAGALTRHYEAQFRKRRFTPA